jgi:hypothetical protein
MRKFLIGLAAATLFSVQAIASHAVLFGLVNPKGNGEPYFFDNGGADNGTFGISPAALDVEFTFLVPNSCAAIGVPIDATLTLTALATSDAVIGPPSTQPLVTYAFTITEDGSGDNLLSGTAPVAFLSQSATETASLATSGAFGLTFTSDCLAFVAGSESATFSFSSTTPDDFAADTDGQLVDTFFNGNGNFSSDLLVQVPEPGVMGLLFSSCIGGGLLFARRRIATRR